MLRNDDGTDFLPEVDYATGGSGTTYLDPLFMRLITGDFNSDGVADLAVTNKTSGKIYVFTGNGDGTFAAAVAYRAGGSPIALAAGDFNGDGALDLPVANQGSWPNPDFLNILMGNGDGTFQAARKISLKYGGTLTGIAASDVDYDGLDDLVIGGSFGKFIGENYLQSIFMPCWGRLQGCSRANPRAL
ncbi:MAG: FG-GAP repeat domain-containing protein [Bacillota bacterium]